MHIRNKAVTNYTKDGEMARRWNKVKKGVKLVISMAFVLTMVLINPVNLVPHGMFAPEEHDEYLLTQDGRLITKEEHQRIHEEMAMLGALNTVSAESPNECPYTTLCTAGTSNYRFVVEPWNDPRWPYHGDNGGYHDPGDHNRGGNEPGRYQVIISYYTCNVCGGKSAVSYIARWDGVTHDGYNAHGNNPQSIVHKNITKYGAHAWSEWTVYQPATCTTNSMSRRSCSICGAVENRENTNASLGPVAFGHDYKVTACTYPDSVNPGSITFVCQNDPTHTVTNAITLGDWNIYFKEGRVQKVALGDKLLNLLYAGDIPLRPYVENGVDPITGERNRILH